MTRLVGLLKMRVNTILEELLEVSKYDYKGAKYLMCSVVRDIWDYQFERKEIDWEKRCNYYENQLNGMWETI